MQITTERSGDVAIIRWANPPLNALNDGLRAALATSLRQHLDDAAVRAIVLTAEGGDFCAGANAAVGAPSLADLCGLIETAPKPVIVALRGAVLGDGLDLALACHFRVAARDVRLGAPGVRLELPPRAGATQRLPRLCGAAAALSLLLRGGPRPPMPGFLDAPLADDPLASALNLARDVQGPRPTSARRDGLGDTAGFIAAVVQARGALSDGPLMAPERIVTCVEAAMMLPFEVGLEMERAAYDDCRTSPASLALHHLIGAEARARVLPEATGGRARAIRRVAVLGGTARAGELALSCLDAGCQVLLVELEPQGQAIVLERILDLYDDAVARGTLGAAERDARLLRIQPEASFDDLAGVDLVWEAGPDVPALKREMWSAIGLMARPGALLLSSGGAMAPEILADLEKRAGDLLTVHIPGAAHTGPLAELRPAAGANPDSVATALALLHRLQRHVVRGADVPGGLVQHLAQVFERTVEALLLAGHRADAIDRALVAYGFRTGPCAALDLRGLDQVLAQRRAAPGGTEVDLALLDLLVESGLTGRGVGAGLLQWGANGPEGEPEATRALIDALADVGVPCAGKVAPDLVAPVCAAALAAAGAALIAEGLVAQAGDIDVAAVHGLGFPRWRGGPMMAADQRGLLRVSREAALAGAAAPVGPVFDECIKNGTALARFGRR